MFSEERLEANVVLATIEVLDAGSNCHWLSDIYHLMALTVERLERRWGKHGWPSSGLPVASKCLPDERRAAKTKWVVNHPLMRLLQARLDWAVAGFDHLSGPKFDDDDLRWAYARAHHVERGWSYDGDA
jgi:hypothetical protein